MRKHIICAVALLLPLMVATNSFAGEKPQYNVFVEGNFRGKISCFSKHENAEGVPVVKGCMSDLDLERDMVCKGVFKVPQPKTCVELKEAPTQRINAVKAYMEKRFGKITIGHSI